MDAFFLGTFLLQGTFFFLLGFIVCVALTHFQVLEEESFLSKEYGDDYRTYRQSTPRYVGWVRKAEALSPQT
jgi:protein-S-isoprenylcysteine O-methyltransferase Ste14